jgi:nitrogen fixation protein NifQ
MSMRPILQVDEAQASALSADLTLIEERTTSAEAYRKLTGVSPDRAEIDGGESFDRHVLASILALGATEPGPLADRVGLSETDLDTLCSLFFPNSRLAGSAEGEIAASIDIDEMDLVRDLLLSNRSSVGDFGQWLAAMVARRALEPNHLWEDLGLRERSELTRLIQRHFAPLAVRNDKNMRWKRFIYRMMCENDGFVMCSTPVCTSCADYNLCYGEEKGTSRMVPPSDAPIRGL